MAQPAVTGTTEYGAGASPPSAADEVPPREAYSTDAACRTRFTDPHTQAVYVLNPAGTDWLPLAEADQAPPPASQPSDPAQPSPYRFDGQTYTHRRADGQRFKWDLVEQSWAEDNSGQSSEESELDSGDEAPRLTEAEQKERAYRQRRAQPGWGQKSNYLKDPETGAELYRDAQDGMLYEWDREKNAWFPRIDEDFMAQYQLNYGFTPDGQAEPTRPEPQKEVVEQEKKPEPQNLEEGEEAPSQSKKPKWFEEDAAKTTKVYVSGLPAEVTEDTFVAFMSKCGMIEIDVRSNKPKARLYMDKASGTPKGDGLCTYVKQESVQLALQILDGSKWAESEVRVERAKFEMKGEKYDARLKPKKLKKKELELLKKKHEKYLAWEVDRLRGERSKKEKVIVVKNLFDPEEFDEDASRILEYSQKLREQCAKFGTVKKVTVHDKHPEGVAQVWFETAEEADMAISMVHGRLFFNQKVMKAETWDGKTKYKVKESEEEERERLAKWEKFLEEEEEGEKEPAETSHEAQ